MPNGNIGLTQQKVAHHVVGRDLEPESRGLFGQAVEHFWQQVGRRPLSRRDPHLTVDLLRLAGGRQRHQVSAGGHGAHMFQEIEPRGIHMRATDFDDLTFHRHHCDTQKVVRCDSILQAMRTA